ncbi:branched-chain amino acid transport system II carrier protein [Priestia megaterium]
MSNKVPLSFIVILGLMLFALFFGAGNLIFPPMLGASAGTNLWLANAGFLITGVGLPLLTVLAFGFSGKDDLHSLANRVHSVFGIIFTTIVYLAIGPFFAIPRSGNVSFEIGIKPFLSEHSGPIPLIAFTLIFFSITCFLSLNPKKIVDVIGEFLTPIKLTFIGVLVAVTFIHPIGNFQKPNQDFTSNVFFKGFQNGYLTMDTIAAFVFGIIIVNALKGEGITSKKYIMITCLKAALIAAVILSIMYTSLAYMGASSVQKLGHLDNGGEILAQVSYYYFGSYGQILLGLMITVACLTTSIGLMTACGSFFHKLFPKISYKMFIFILSIFSTIVSDVGLTNIIKLSAPILDVIYPLTIVLIFLTFLHPLFKGRSEVYQFSLFLTLIISLCEGLSIKKINEFFLGVIPMYSIGLGWVLPAVIGGILGFFISLVRKNDNISSINLSKKLNK